LLVCTIIDLWLEEKDLDCMYYAVLLPFTLFAKCSVKLLLSLLMYIPSAVKSGPRDVVTLATPRGGVN
jgi:hypothetical protein